MTASTGHAQSPLPPENTWLPPRGALPEALETGRRPRVGEGIPLRPQPALEGRFCPFTDALPHLDRGRDLGELPAQPGRRVQRGSGEVSGGGPERMARLPPRAGPDHDADHRAPRGSRGGRSVMQQDGGTDSGPKSVASPNRAFEWHAGRNLPPFASLMAESHLRQRPHGKGSFSPPLPTVPTQVV